MATTYGDTFTSVVAKDNVMGVQFSPEKVRNWIKINFKLYRIIIDVKKRLIAVILVLDGRVVKVIKFKHTNVIHYDAIHAT